VRFLAPCSGSFPKDTFVVGLAAMQLINRRGCFRLNLAFQLENDVDSCRGQGINRSLRVTLR
jgi:hypothetical protein